MGGLTPNEMNTPAAQRRKEWFKRVAKEKFAPSAPPEELKSPAKEKDQKAPHADSRLPSVAVLAKGYRYAERGSVYLRAQNGRGVYLNVDEQYVKEEFGELNARFPDPAAPQNFDPGARLLGTGKKAKQKYPYAWEAHHLLPGSAFYYETKQGPAFTQQQYEILLATDYNINRGHNIIMLPKQAPAVPVHKLIQHPSDHPEYTQLVMADLKTLSDDLQALIDQSSDHEAVKASLASELDRLEDSYWKVVVALGRDSVRVVSAGDRLDDRAVDLPPRNWTDLTASPLLTVEDRCGRASSPKSRSSRC